MACLKWEQALKCAPKDSPPQMNIIHHYGVAPYDLNRDLERFGTEDPRKKNACWALSLYIEMMEAALLAVECRLAEEKDPAKRVAVEPFLIPDIKKTIEGLKECRTNVADSLDSQLKVITAIEHKLTSETNATERQKLETAAMALKIGAPHHRY